MKDRAIGLEVLPDKPAPKPEPEPQELAAAAQRVRDRITALNEEITRANHLGLVVDLDFEHAGRVWAESIRHEKSY